MDKTINNILVTDGEDRHALAIIRSLGRKGHTITAVSHDSNPISFLSKYVSYKINSPLSSNHKEYGDFLLNLIKKNKYDVLVVCTEHVINILSQRRQEFAPFVKFALPSNESFKITADKIATLKYAAEKKIPMPRTVFPESIEQAFEKAKVLEYPFVIKGSQGSGAANVDIVYGKHEFENKYLKVIENLKDFGVEELPMLQEFVEGVGYGFSTIYNNGKRIAHFMHRRLLQYPSAAGQCVIAHQVFEKELEESGTRLFDSLDWHSVGMAEFRKDVKDGIFKLMEINPRFWGSVDLPIRLGIDFADLYRRLALNEDLQEIKETNKQSKDFLFLFPHAVVSFMESPKQFFQVYKQLERKNTLTDYDSKDFRPLFRQLRLTFWHIRKHLKKYGFRNLEKTSARKGK